MKEGGSDLFKLMKVQKIMTEPGFLTTSAAMRNDSNGTLQSLYIEESDINSYDEQGIGDANSPNYVPFDNDTSPDYVPFASGRKGKRRLSQELSIGLRGDLTDEMRFELGKQAGPSGGKHRTALKYSKLWNLPISSNIVSREHWKYQMLREMYKQEPTLEIYQKHRGDGITKLTAEQKAEILEYLKYHGATETAKHFSPKYKLLLNEAHIRTLLRAKVKLSL